jgi:hypothetical protein
MSASSFNSEMVDKIIEIFREPERYGVSQKNVEPIVNSILSTKIENMEFWFGRTQDLDKICDNIGGNGLSSIMSAIGSDEHKFNRFAIILKDPEQYGVQNIRLITDSISSVGTHKWEFWLERLSDLDKFYRSMGEEGLNNMISVIGTDEQLKNFWRNLEMVGLNFFKRTKEIPYTVKVEKITTLTIFNVEGREKSSRTYERSYLDERLERGYYKDVFKGTTGVKLVSLLGEEDVSIKEVKGYVRGITKGSVLRRVASRPKEETIERDESERLEGY